MRPQAQPRVDLAAPPPHEVEWRVSCGRRTTRVVSQLWMAARIVGAKRLGVMPELCKCVRLDEVKLTGTGRA